MTPDGNETPALIGAGDADAFEAMKALFKRANAGDAKALREVVERTEGSPKSLIHYGHGDLADLAERVMLQTQLSKFPASQLAVEERMREIRRELGAGTSTPLEKLLISRIALCWLDVHTLDTMVAMNSDRRAKVVEALDRRLERTERRYIRAIKALATVRRLDMTAILVNQVTVAAAPNPDSSGSRRTGCL
jgi:hypothetical protein